MKKEIKEFLKGNEKVLLMKYEGGRLNALWDWAKWRNPFRMFLSGIVYEFCKIIPPCEFKNMLLRATGMKIGKQVSIAPEVKIDPIFPELITIEDGAIIGWGARILTHEATIKHFRLGRVKIGKQSIVGAFSTMRSGVTIGKNSIVAMGSFVNKDVKDKEEVGGVPYHKIKKLKKLI